MCLFDDDDLDSCRESIEDILDALSDSYYVLQTKQEAHPDLLKRIREILETHRVV